MQDYPYDRNLDPRYQTTRNPYDQYRTDETSLQADRYGEPYNRNPQFAYNSGQQPNHNSGRYSEQRGYGSQPNWQQTPQQRYSGGRGPTVSDDPVYGQDTYDQDAWQDDQRLQNEDAPYPLTMRQQPYTGRYTQQPNFGTRQPQRINQGNHNYSNLPGSQYGNDVGQGQNMQTQSRQGYGTRWNSDSDSEHYRMQGSRANRFGKSPKNYKRSDERIREDIADRIMHNASVDASDVEIQVDGGQVILEGTVSQRWMKHTIEDVADDIAGVDDVDNRIRVKQTTSASSSSSDSDTSRSSGTSSSSRPTTSGKEKTTAAAGRGN